MALEEIFPEVFVAHGRMRFGPGVSIGKLMTVVRQGRDLVVINSAALGDEDERALRALGTVKHLVRIGAGHGLDDAWYVERFAPVTWGRSTMPVRASGKPQRELAEGGELPLDGKAFVFATGKANEAAILLERDGGILITCDALQAWRDTRDCSWLGGVLSKRMGFLSAPVVIGPVWLKNQTGGQPAQMRPDFERLLALPFAHLVPGHGDPLRDQAKAHVQASVAKSLA